MASVGDGKFAIRSDERRAAGEEAGHLSAESGIEVSKHLRRRSHGTATQCADDRANGHGRFKPLPANVTNYDQERSIGPGKNLEEISTNLLRGQVDVLNCESRRGWHVFRNEQGLHASGCF